MKFSTKADRDQENTLNNQSLVKVRLFKVPFLSSAALMLQRSISGNLH